MDRPRFRGHLQVEVLAPDLVVMASENESHSFPGRLYPLIVPMIDGRNTVHDIIDGLAGRANALDVRTGLEWLAADGLIRDAGTTEPRRLPNLEHLREPVRARPGPAPLRVTLSALGRFPLDAFREALARHGITVDEGAAFGILLVNDYLRDEIGLFNRHALQSGKRWLIARPSAVAPWIGPLFRPGVTPCWNCLALRLRENRPVHTYIAEHRRRLGVFPTTESEGLSVALDVVASRLARWAAGDERDRLEAGLLALNAAGTTFERHAVVSMPHCEACFESDAARNASPVPLQLGNSQPVEVHDGGYRTARPEETVARLRELVSPLTGAIGFVEHRGTDDIRLVVADHPFRFDRQPRHVLKSGGRHKSAGKGLGAAQAEASAMCEAIERYSGLFRGDERRRTARFVDIEREAVHPDRCLNFSERQYVERDRWNAMGHQKLWVPRPFDPQQSVEWSPAWSLTNDAPRWLPTALCYYGYPQDAEQELCPVDSNGNAAGNTIEEAILQGFLELVERDAVATWWYNRLVQPAVRLDSFDAAGIAESVAAYAAHDRDITVLDLTSDFRIPVFAALSRRTAGDEELLLGFGAHFDPDIALARAVTEMGQFLPACRGGRWSRPFTAALEDDGFLRPDPGLPPRDRDAYAKPTFPDLGGCVSRCVALADGLGLETLVLDQTRADIGLPVVRVVVPGMRHFTARLGAGRLYDVPVALGRKPRPLHEDDLNPSHIVI